MTDISKGPAVQILASKSSPSPGEDGPPLGPFYTSGTPKGGRFLGVVVRNPQQRQEWQWEALLPAILFIWEDRPKQLLSSGPLLGDPMGTFPPAVVSCGIPTGNRQVEPLLAAEKCHGIAIGKALH